MQAEDSFVDELWSAAPASGASLLSALFPRCFVDPNRALDDVDPEVGGCRGETVVGAPPAS